MDNQPVLQPTQTPPPQQPATNQQPAPSPPTPKSSWKLPLILLVVVIFAGSLYGVYAWQHKNVSDTNTKVSSLQSQVSSLQSQLSKPKTKTATTLPSQVSQAPSSFVFKELGIKFIPAKSLVGLRYTITAPTSSDEGGAYLSDASTDAAFNKCQIDSTTSNTSSSGPTAEGQSFAAITKVKGTYSNNVTTSIAPGQLVKQFNGFYITIDYPNGPTCQGSQSDQSNWHQAAGSAAKDFQQSLSKTIEQN